MVFLPNPQPMQQVQPTEFPEASLEDFQIFADTGGSAEFPEASLADFQMFAGKPPKEQERRGILNEFTSGMGAGLSQLRTDAIAARAVFNDLTEDKAQTDELVGIIQERSRDLQERNPRTIEKVEDIETLGDFTRWASRTLGEQVPVVGSIVLGGGLSGLLGRMTAKGLIKRQMATQLATKLPTVAGTAGAVGTAGTIETGVTAEEQIGAIGEIDAPVAIAAGAAKGALEAVVPAALGSKLGITKDLTGGLINKVSQTYAKVVPRRLKVLAGAGAYGGAEALTESLQETVDIAARSFVDENYEALGEDGRSRLLNAAASGALVGTIFGGMFGGPRSAETGAAPPSQEQAQEIPEEVLDSVMLGVPEGETSLSPAFPGATPVVVPPVIPQGYEEKATAGVVNTERDFGLEESGTSLGLGEGANTARERTSRSINEAYGSIADIFNRAAEAERNRPLVDPDGSVHIFDREKADKEWDEILSIIDEGEISKTRDQASVPIDNTKVSPREVFDFSQQDLRYLAGLPYPVSQTPTRYAETKQIAARMRPYVDLRLSLRKKQVTEWLTENIPEKGRKTENFRQFMEFFNATGNLLHEEVANKLVDSNVIHNPALAQHIAHKEIERELEQAMNPLLDEYLYYTETNPDGLAGMDTNWSIGMASEGELRANLAEALTDKAMLGEHMFDSATEGVLSPSAVKEGKTEEELKAEGVGGALLGGTAKTLNTFLKGPTGKATVISDDKANRPLENKLVQFAEGVLAQLNIDARVVVINGDLSGMRRDSWARSLGSEHTYRMNDGSNTVVITSNYGKSLKANRRSRLGGLKKQTELQAFETFTHELGHAIIATKFAAAPIEVKLGIMIGYQQAVAEVNNKDVKGFLDNFLDTSGILTSVDRSPEFIKRTALEGAGKTYWINADEWLANQFVRSILEPETSPVQLEGPIGKFFKELQGHMKKVLKMAKNIAIRTGLVKKEEAEIRFSPSQYYTKFLEYTKQRTNELSQAGQMDNGVLDLHNTMEQTTEVSKRQNARTLRNMGIDNGESAPPKTVMSERMRSLMKHAKIPKQTQDEIAAPADKMNWFMDKMLTIQQIALENPHIQKLQEYVELVDRWNIGQMRWISMADSRVKEWKSMPRKLRQNFDKFIFAVEDMQYLAPTELEPRLPTEQELKALADKYGIDQSGIELYHKLQGDFKQIFEFTKDLARKDILATFKDPISQQAKLQKLEKEFAAWQNKPYFPHARFGKYAIVVRDPKTTKPLYIEHVDSKREAKRRRAHIAGLSEFKDADTRLLLVPEIVQGFQGMPPSVLENFRDKLEVIVGPENTEVRQFLDDFIHEVALTTGMREKLAKRRGIAGYSKDGMRAYAHYFFKNAKHFSRMEWGGKIQRVIQDFDDEIKLGDVTNPDVTKKGMILNHLKDHNKNIMNPKADWAALRSFAFMWWLGFNPSAAALNFTQLPLVTVPYLSSRYGDAAALNELRKAITGIPKYYNAREGNAPENMDPSLIKALEIAIQEGVVDESQATELAGIAQGNYVTSLMPDNKAHEKWMELLHWGGMMFQMTEKMNRRITFRAGWELARKQPRSEYLDGLVKQHRVSYNEMLSQGMSDIDARSYLAAKDAVRTTQYQYAAHARPKFMRGKAGTLFTFFMFTQQTMYFAARQPGAARFWLTMLAAGGIMGLPGGDDLMAISKFIANSRWGKQLLGEHFDPELEVRKMVTEMTDGTIPPDLILLGSSRYGFGMPAIADMMGLPLANFDMSSRIGMGSPIPGLQELLKHNTMGPDAALSQAATSVAGAAFGPGINFYKFLNDPNLPYSDLKRWERAMPAGMANVTRAFRYATEERERTRTGATVVDFDMSDPLHVSEVGLRALGFQPTRVAQRWDREFAVKEVQNYWSAQRAVLMARFDRTFYDFFARPGGADARREVLMDIQAYNKKVPYGGLKITSTQIKGSRKARTKAKRLYELGLAGGRPFTQLNREIGELFPEVDVGPSPT